MDKQVPVQRQDVDLGLQAGNDKQILRPNEARVVKSRADRP